MQGRFKPRGSAWIAFALVGLGAAPGVAAPLRVEQVPQPLAPWVGWALRGHEARMCPARQGVTGESAWVCRWPSRLVLVLDDHEGAFEQEWRMWREDFVPLPGDAKRWPEDVHVDDAAAAVIEQGGRPVVRLPAGSHKVAGRFPWKSMPPTLAVPPETGLVTLQVRGEVVPSPVRDEAGRLWLAKRAETQEEPAGLEVSVWRRVIDDVPMRIETRVELKVSGPGREELLARPLPADFVPMSIESPLPARLEPDGRLLVQARPGRWVLTVTARSAGPVERLAFDPVEGPWADREIWAFDARPALRLVQIEGASAVDPGQTRLPEDWSGMPTYVVAPGEGMTFVVKRRGESAGAAEPLSLHRQWWLDFAGTGYTVHDVVSGALRRPQRLDAAAGTDLGHVAIDGQDQFITRWGPTNALGVELRAGPLRLEADSRVEGDPVHTPAVGWNRDFHDVSGELHLPPGWRLAHARGVDAADPTWIRAWTLLDLFGALVTTVAVFQLWGLLWGLIGALTLALTWTEPGAPSWIWLAFLVGEALVRAVGSGDAEGASRRGFRRWLRVFRLAALLAVVLTSIPFMVREVRVALYPALEYAFWSVGEEDPYARGAAAPAEAPMALEDEMASARPASPKPTRSYESAVYTQPDPNARVQTGPGLPAWRWNSARLTWRGPVDRDQGLELFLLSPRVNIGLAAARTVLLGVLLLGLAGGRGLLRFRRGAAVAMIAALAVVAAPAVARAEFPSKELLDELRERLLEAPECAPNCAASERMLVEAAPDGLRIRLDVGAADLTAIPLPGSLDEWSPELVTVDGGPAGAMSRTPDGRLWLVLTQGPHQLVLEGPLARRESVRLHLPLRPKRLEARLAGWTLAGLRDDGSPEDTLELTRERPESEDARREIEPGALPPFVTVDRSLLLGVDWRVRTVARRRTPLGTPIVLKVPLLPGEAVLTAGIDVRDGAALVNLGPRAASAGWESTLPAGPRIDLRAAESGSLGERWHLRASPIWHVEFEGILPIYREEAKSDAGLTWAPWPGESVTVSIDRPAGAEGPTLTIDRASLIVRPGLRAVDGVLEMSIRSSRGTQHPIGLPKGAILESVAIGGQAQPVEAIDGVVTVPIAPGTTALRVAWRSPGGPGRRLETPRVDLGAPAVNLDIRVESSRDRWILFAGGPRVGPAVLFWSFLVILLPLAWVLGRLPWTPLRARHWFGLGVGLTQVNIVVAAVVAGWLFALGWRRVRPGLDDRGAFNLRQIALVLWTLVALAGLVWGIEQGLLGLPEMQIAGNGSGPELLRWFVDRTPARVPVAWVLSAPLYAYRVAMLLWALWIAWALIRWLRWGWECFGTGGYWRPRAPRAEGPVRGLRVPDDPSGGDA